MCLRIVVTPSCVRLISARSPRVKDDVGTTFNFNALRGSMLRNVLMTFLERAKTTSGSRQLVVCERGSARPPPLVQLQVVGQVPHDVAKAGVLGRGDHVALDSRRLFVLTEFGQSHCLRGPHIKAPLGLSSSSMSAFACAPSRTWASG